MYTCAANPVFLVHAVNFLILVFGWAIPALWPIYMGVLVATLTSLLFLSYCPLTKWEFELRKKVDPTVECPSGFLNLYAYKLVGMRISDTFIYWTGIFFLSASIAISVYFRFFFIT